MSPSARCRSKSRVRPEEDIMTAKAKHTASTSASTTKGSSFHSSSFHDNTNNNNSFASGSSLRSVKNKELCPVTGYLSDISVDYQLSSTVLGKGHYGCVRECTHRVTRKRYACKSIDKSKIGRLDHLQREVYLLSKTNHPSIMRMVDCYEDPHHVHIVTEKYTGGELFDRIIENTAEEGCFSEQRAASIIKSLLESVAYLHKNGIVHRDIKPENILFETKDEDSAIRLIDFGLSRKYKQGDKLMCNPVGTAYYMSPELLRGKYDHGCDVWSVGTVAYILLAGYPPFNGNEDPDIFDAIKKGSFSFPSKAWGNKSSASKDFIKCLLRKDPRKRFNAEEALCHPWLQIGNAAPVKRQDELMTRLQSIRKSIKAIRVSQ
mmetsp:Transcript_35763/g.85287  ORF Transcript_35763/g.85287 Transcript_35763/m.85287 type:complete len:376 (-) Transcript_35763:35-1162(-)